MNTAGPNDGTFLKIGEPQDVFINHNTIFQSGPVTWAYDTTYGFVFTNNIVNNNISAGGYQGIYGPGFTQGNNTIAYYFPDVTDSNMHLNKNVMIGGDSSKYSNYSNQSFNYFPAIITDVGFVNYSNGAIDYHDYALNSLSNYLNSGSDNKDIGVNVSVLDSALNALRDCHTLTSISDYEIENAIRIFPNPSEHILNIELKYTIGDRFYLTDLSGRIIFQDQFLNDKYQLNIESFSPGTYIIRVINDAKIVSKPFYKLN